MSGPFHAGEREMQRRAGGTDEAEAVGRIIGRALPKGVEGRNAAELLK